MAMFTTIAAGVGMATTLGTAGASFAQASKQRKAQQRAETTAERALMDARKKLDVNYYEQLGIQKESYELEREALLSAGAQAMQLATEGDIRGAAATAGRVQMAQQQGQREIAGAMGQELMGLDKLVSGEDARLAGLQSNLSLAEAEGAQLAARDAQQQAAAATTQGLQSIQSAGQQLYEAAPLFEKSQGMKQFDKLKGLSSKYNLTKDQLQNDLAEFGKANVDFDKLAGVGYSASSVDAGGKPIQGLMTTPVFQDYYSSLGKRFGQSVFDPFSQFLQTKYPK